MTSAVRFQQIERLFQTCRDLAAGERAALLDASCGDDDDLRRDVLDLLVEHDKASPLDAAPTEMARTALAEVDAHPERIGRYEVVRVIGEGGMGVVYEAIQADPARHVAVKVIKLGMDTREVIARFEVERRALGVMDHPGIARVFDAGVTEAGRPFFAMELVDGVPLLDFCDAGRLSTEARLRLFVRVCRAIQHAHAKGIIHRDLKPSHVLVAMLDGEPVPKVIDFGIAKATDAGIDGRTHSTQHGQVIGTPAYMSPEQADTGGVDVDTRSDVYALGVLLYELLAGSPPFDLDELMSRGFSEAMRVIRQDDPARPSTRFRCADDTSVQVARARGADVDRLHTLLQGDLDWIVLKCLEKDRERRYDTANALADDIERSLADEPVVAVPQTTSYRFGKFIRRNRRQVIAAATIAVVLVLGVIGTTGAMLWALDESTAARIATLAEADAKLAAQQSANAATTSAGEARDQAETAEAIIDFLLNDLLGAADPARTKNRELTVREAVHIASELIEDRFADRPVVEARVRVTIARTLTQIGVYVDAEPHLRRALDLLVPLHGAAAVEVLDAQRALATNLMQKSRFDDAIEITERMLAAIDAADDPALDSLRLSALGNLGVAYLQTGRYEDATPILEQTLDAKRRLLGDRDQSTLTSMHNLAGLYGQLGQSSRSLELSREAYAGRLEVLGAGDPRTFGSLNLITWMLRTEERFDEVEALLDDAITTAQDRLGPGHPKTLELTKTLGVQFLQRQMFDEAEPILRRVVEEQRKQDPDLENINTLSAMQNLGMALRQLDRLDEAIALYCELELRAREVFPERGREQALVRREQGRTFADAKRFAEAEAALLDAHSMMEAGAALRADDLEIITELLAAMYGSWDDADPDSGHDASAATWRSRLEETERE